LKAFARVKDFSRAPVNRQNGDKPLAPRVPVQFSHPSSFGGKKYTEHRAPLLF